MIEANKKADFAIALNLVTLALNSISLLKRLLYIYYLVQFKKNQIKIWALLDFRSKINVMLLVYIPKLDL